MRMTDYELALYIYSFTTSICVSYQRLCVKQDRRTHLSGAGRVQPNEALALAVVDLFMQGIAPFITSIAVVYVAQKYTYIQLFIYFGHV